MDENRLEEYALRCADADDFHNLAVGLLNETNRTGEAFMLVKRGLDDYPYDIDLLADAVRWAPVGEQKEWIDPDSRAAAGADEGLQPIFAEDYFKVLRAQQDRWNWRAYDFSIDYLLDKRLNVLADPALRKAALNEAIELAEKFVDSGIDVDRAHGAYVKALIAAGRRREAEERLDEVVFGDGAQGAPVAACCLRYVDLLMGKGDFEKAIRAARKGMAYTAQSQPSASIGYFVYCEALAQDALLGKEISESFELSSSAEDQDAVVARVNAICDLYTAAEKMLGDRKQYLETIGRRKCLLEKRFLSGNPSVAFAGELQQRLDAQEVQIGELQQRLAIQGALFGELVQKLEGEQ